MTLINCPECGKEISDKAQSCPNCGFPLTTSNKIKYGLENPSALFELISQEKPFQKKCEMEDLANNNYGPACFFIGKSCLNGENGYEKDIDLGTKWLERGYYLKDSQCAYLYHVVKSNRFHNVTIDDWKVILHDFELNDNQKAAVLNRIGVLYADKYGQDLNDVDSLKNARYYFEKSIDLNKEYALDNLLSSYVTSNEIDALEQMIKQERYLDTTEDDATSHVAYRICLAYRDGKFMNSYVIKNKEKYEEYLSLTCNTSLTCGYWYVEAANYYIGKSRDATYLVDKDKYIKISFDLCQKGLTKKPVDNVIYGKLYNLLGIICGDPNTKLFNFEASENYYLEAIRRNNNSAENNLQILRNNNFGISSNNNTSKIISVQIISTQDVRNGKSTVMRSIVGGFLFGGLGVLGGIMTSKRDLRYTFLVIYDNGRRETISTTEGTKEFELLIQFVK